MIPTNVTRMLTQPGFVPARKHSYAHGIPLPVLPLCLVMAAWGQTAAGIKGPHRLLDMPGVIPSIKPAADTPASSQYKFITIANEGSLKTEPQGINKAGLVTGYYEDASTNYHGFVWQDGSLQTIDYPGAVSTYLFAVNDQGVAIGLYGDGAAEHAVMYSVAGGLWTALPDIPSYPENEAYGINDAGAAVGNAYSADSSASVAWVWLPNKSEYIFFTEPGAVPSGTYPSAINDKGQMVGSFCTTDPCYNASFELYGFLRQGKTYTIIDAPTAGGTYANGINNGGTIVGQWQDATVFAPQGFVLTNGGLFTTVDYPGPELTGLTAINDYGDISGVYIGKSGDVKGFVGLRQ